MFTTLSKGANVSLTSFCTSGGVSGRDRPPTVSRSRSLGTSTDAVWAGNWMNVLPIAVFPSARKSGQLKVVSKVV